MKQTRLKYLPSHQINHKIIEFHKQILQQNIEQIQIACHIKHIYLIDKLIESMMPNTLGANSHFPSTLTLLSRTNGNKHRAHSFGILPIYRKKKKTHQINSQIEFFCAL